VIKHFAIDLKISSPGSIETLVGRLRDNGCVEKTVDMGSIKLYDCQGAIVLLTLHGDTLLLDLINASDALIEKILDLLPPAKTVIRMLERGFPSHSTQD